MKIYIPSKGRPSAQKTYLRLPKELQSITRIVVPSEDYIDYVRNWGPETVLEAPVRGIAPTRDWIFQYARLSHDVKIVMLDDDLIFQRLRANGKIDNSQPEEVIAAFAWLNSALDTYAHAGMSVRFSDKGGGTTDKSPSRMMHVLGYNITELPGDVQFCKGVTDPERFSMDDFNMTLQLLTRGIPNIVSSEWRTSPSAGNAKGGASTWRTLETQNQSAADLKRMFPAYVSLRRKNNWQGMGGGDMWDVTVQWKGAYRGALR